MRTRISLSKFDILKKELGILLPDVKSSHRVEAVARGLGWNTNAALRAELAEGPSTRTVDEATFGRYLAEHGFPDIRNGVLAEAFVRADIAATRQAIMAIMEREPDLTPNGYAYKGMKPAQRTADFDGHRASMLSEDHVAQFVRAQEFLLTVPRTKQVTRKVSSYGYKHQVEAFQKEKSAPDYYVANGMFIAAALDLDFIVARIPDSPNAFLNIGSSKPESPPPRSAILATGASGQTWEAWRNITVAAINAGLEQGHFGLEPDDNRFDGNDHVYYFDLDGIPAIACAQAASSGGLLIQAALHPTKRSERNIRILMSGCAAGDGCSMGILERMERKHLESKGHTRPSGHHFLRGWRA